MAEQRKTGPQLAATVTEDFLAGLAGTLIQARDACQAAADREPGTQKAACLSNLASECAIAMSWANLAAKELSR